MPDDLFDLRTILAIVGTMVGLCGFLFGILSHLWVRRESGLASLEKILAPMIRCAQHLMRANNSRRIAEQLKRSYQDTAIAPEAAYRINEQIDVYNSQSKDGQKAFCQVEEEFGSRAFRFPPDMAKKIKSAWVTLQEMSELIANDSSDKADLHLARFRDQIGAIYKSARGWRFVDPIGLIRKRFQKQPTAPAANEFELTQKEMDGVMALVMKRANSQSRNTFAVHPPKAVIDDPSLLTSDQVVDRLKDSVFSVVFQDGTVKMLSLPELTVFIHNLVTLTGSAAEVEAMAKAISPSGPFTFSMKGGFSMQELMQPQMAKALLGKIEFADTPSDG